MSKSYKSEMCLHTGHRQRVFNSILSGGYKQAYSHQVLEALLMYPIPRSDTNPVAHRLIGRFKSIDAVLNASDKELLSIRGFGHKSLAFIRDMGNVYHYLNEYELRNRITIDSYEGLIELLYDYNKISGCHIFFANSYFELESIIDLNVGDKNPLEELSDRLQSLLGNDACNCFLTYSYDEVLSSKFIGHIHYVYKELKAYGFNFLDCLVLKDGKVYSPFSKLYEIVLQTICEVPKVDLREFDEELFNKSRLGRAIAVLNYEIGQYNCEDFYKL